MKEYYLMYLNEKKQYCTTRCITSQIDNFIKEMKYNGFTLIALIEI